ncbi:hypothetical protein [Tautonia plasticadhaerens]|uniref:hypothetical protein n=1 Tax=Tautonia plasticadhaerens TaxID=2527974 RepID=UPI0011A57D83|nr:hypothetical protein [Tautonia plasticadhaerens]
MWRMLLLSSLAVVGCSHERNDSRFISGQRVQVVPSNGQAFIRLESSDPRSPIVSQDPASSILTLGDEVHVLHDDDAAAGEDRVVEVETLILKGELLKHSERVRGFMSRSDLRTIDY